MLGYLRHWLHLQATHATPLQAASNRISASVARLLAVHQEKNFFLIFEWQNGVRLKHYTGNAFRLQWASGIFPFTMEVWWRVKPCHRMHAFQPASSTLTMHWFFQKLMYWFIFYRVSIILKCMIDNGFVLCNLHDIKNKTQQIGSPKMARKAPNIDSWHLKVCNAETVCAVLYHW